MLSPQACWIARVHTFFRCVLWLFRRLAGFNICNVSWLGATWFGEPTAHSRYSWLAQKPACAVALIRMAVSVHYFCMFHFHWKGFSSSFHSWLNHCVFAEVVINSDCGCLSSPLISHQMQLQLVTGGTTSNVKMSVTSEIVDWTSSITCPLQSTIFYIRCML